ncbi:MAG: CsbD family protein [Formivibrio sp.]|nr:CsbD family protein [Formivibrio sp.]
MNKDQVKGIAKDIAGKVQEETGKLVGSKEQQIKGLDKQISGKAEKNFGNAKEVIKDVTKNTHKHF